MIVVQLLTNKQGEATLMGGAISAMPVTSWPVSAAGSHSSTLRRPCRKMRMNETKGWGRNAARTVGNKAETTGTKCKVTAGSALGRWPNPALHVTAARWRLRLTLHGSGWAAAREGER